LKNGKINMFNESLKGLMRSNYFKFLVFLMMAAFIAAGCGGSDDNSQPNDNKPFDEGLPTASITSPEDDSVYVQGDNITFTGTGNHPKDGTLSGNSLVWSSNIDGQLGNGESVSVDNLSNGTHTITLSVAGSDYANARDSITVSVADHVNSLGMTFNLIPAGTFLMGNPIYTPPGSGSYASPQHQVTLTQSFYMQTTEVTIAQWEMVMGRTRQDIDCPNCPMVVEREESMSYCNSLSIIDGLTPCYYTDDTYETVYNGQSTRLYSISLNQSANGYRLPTEAQWEYAARAGSTTDFANGDFDSSVSGCGYDANMDAMGWYCYNSNDRPHEVAQKDSNAWGLYDMHGNVWEYCQDVYRAYPTDSVTDPENNSGPGFGVQRGGSYYLGAGACSSHGRVYYTVDEHPDEGFRPIRLQ
jgi:formylglycine-generating enzyme required for sulfatase activity